MNVLDLFCGLGGFSRAFRERGHRVVGLDLVPPCDVLGDVSRLPIRGSWDVLLASPPCTEFSREDQPWTRTGKVPETILVTATRAAVERLRPRFWVVENVRGAVRWFNDIFGLPSLRMGSRWFWGSFPLILKGDESDCVGKARMSSSWRRQRAVVPYRVSLALCKAMEEAT